MSFTGNVIYGNLSWLKWKSASPFFFFYFMTIPLFPDHALESVTGE